MTPGARYVPPRPNPGPEPWPEAWAPWWLWLAPLLAAALAILAIGWARRRRAHRPPAGAFVERDKNPRIAHAAAVRAGLIARFGPSWRSRTTEEIADDPALADLVGPEWAGPLIDLLRAADLAKFSGEPAADERDDGRGAWVVAFLDAFQANVPLDPPRSNFRGAGSHRPPEGRSRSGTSDPSETVAPAQGTP